ncbi:hypothetical protein FQR65_LT07571 [Abscondita terminalis]|nr:hypothetical protein FQR65_LT07571 [Abscondita terminalis]
MQLKHFRERYLQYLLFLAGCFGTLQSGLNDGWSSFALPQYQNNTSTIIALTGDEGSWVASIFLTGAVFGGLLSAVTLDPLGRKTMLLAGTLPLFATWLVIGFAHTIWELCVARFVAGMSEGVVFSCVPVYIAEVAHPKIRGFLITGTSTAYLFGRLYHIIDTVFGSVVVFTRSESPYFYIIKEDFEKAKASMEMFNKNADFDAVKNAVSQQKRKGGSWLEIFTVASNRKSMCFIVVSRICQQFSGAVSFIFYAQTVFRESKDDINPIILLSIYYLLQLTVMIINGIIVDKIGRRPLLVTSMSIVAVALLIVTIYFTLQNMFKINVSDYTWCPIFGLFLYIVGYTLGLQTVLHLLVSEIFPLHVKSAAAALFNISYGIAGTAVLKFFQYTKDEFGLHVPFIVFTICSFCTVPFFMVCVPETKRRTLEDIEQKIRCKQKVDSGLNEGWSSFALPKLLSNSSSAPLSEDEGSWIASFYPLGTMCGSIISVLTLDAWGRKTMLLVGALPYCITWLVIASTRSAWILCVARFLAGTSEGIIFSCVPLFLAEVSDPKIRGFLITGSSTVCIFGIFLINFLGEFFNIAQVAYICLALVIGVCLCLLVPESPYFYLIKQDYNKAKLVMSMYNKTANFDVVQKSLIEQRNGGKFLELFTDASNRKSLCLIVACRVLQQLTGSVSFIFYAQTVFRECQNDISPIIFVSVYYLLQIIMMIINGVTVDRIGRRPLLIASTTIVTFALLIASVYFTLQNMTQLNVADYFWFPVVALFLYIIGYTLGLQNVLYIIVSEIFPLHVKSGAMAMFNASYGISAMLILKYFQFTKDKFGMHVPFITYTICSLCSLPLFALCIPETKRKTLEDIEQSIRSKQTPTP